MRRYEIKIKFIDDRTEYYNYHCLSVYEAHKHFQQYMYMDGIKSYEVTIEEV